MWEVKTVKTYLSAAFTIQGKNVYADGFGNGSDTGGWPKGYINFASASMGEGEETWLELCESGRNTAGWTEDLYSFIRRNYGSH